MIEYNDQQKESLEYRLGRDDYERYNTIREFPLIKSMEKVATLKGGICSCFSFNFSYRIKIVNKLLLSHRTIPMELKLQLLVNVKMHIRVASPRAFGCNYLIELVGQWHVLF